MNDLIDIAKHPVKMFSYEHVLVAHNLIGWIGDFSKLANQLGYKFFLWNDIIYERDGGGCYMRTPYTKEYIR